LWNIFPQYSSCGYGRNLRDGKIPHMLLGILQHSYKENFLQIITSKEQNSSSLIQKTLLGSHQEKLQLEEQQVR